jgi:hypothetical protein
MPYVFFRKVKTHKVCKNKIFCLKKKAPQYFKVIK